MGLKTSSPVCERGGRDVERFDITIRMYSADASGTQYVWDKVPAEEGDFVLYTDAQATIATLQAERDTARRRVDELEAREVDVVMLREDLEQRTAELEAAKAELEQERVRLASCLIAAEGGTKDIVKQGDYGWSPAYRATLNLQAELERVRADNKALDKWRADVTVSLQRPGGAFFVDVPQHIKDLVKARDELRTLIAAHKETKHDAI